MLIAGNWMVLVAGDWKFSIHSFNHTFKLLHFCKIVSKNKSTRSEGLSEIVNIKKTKTKKKSMIYVNIFSKNLHIHVNCDVSSDNLLILKLSCVFRSKIQLFPKSWKKFWSYFLVFWKIIAKILLPLIIAMSHKSIKHHWN